MKRFIALSLFVFNVISISSTSAQQPITFRVDMAQWQAAGKFDPATDSLDLPGSFNDWAGSATLTRVSDTSLVYGITLPLDSLSIVQFRFRINHDSIRTEFTGGSPRQFRIPADTMTVNYTFNDYDTTSVPVTFRCHMGYQIRADHFEPGTDYLDIAGNMNDWGAYDLLFPGENDSTYSITMNISRMNFILHITTSYQFRINGSWLTAEFPEGENREIQIADTAGGQVNLVDVWFRDQDPSVPAPPFVTNVSIQGELYSGNPLSGAYSYEDVNGDPEGISVYQWYTATDTLGTNLTAIDSASAVAYQPTDSVVGKFLVFEVTPKAASGEFLSGETVRVFSVVPVGGVGIGEKSASLLPLWPNPATTFVKVSLHRNFEQVFIHDLTGNLLRSYPVSGLESIRIDLSGLPKGVYLIRGLGRNRVSIGKVTVGF